MKYIFSVVLKLNRYLSFNIYLVIFQLQTEYYDQIKIVSWFI